LDDERKNTSKLPALGDIPLLGRLFSDQEDKKSKTEIVLAITPRIIGNISRPNAEIAEYWSGTEVLINDRPQISMPMSGSFLRMEPELQPDAEQEELPQAEESPEPTAL